MKENKEPQNQKLSSENLADVLWQTLQGVKAGKIHPVEAHAVARQSREIIRVVKAELEAQDIIKKNGAVSVQRLGFGQGAVNKTVKRLS
jgi:hypothetical protein